MNTFLEKGIRFCSVRISNAASSQLQHSSSYVHPSTSKLYLLTNNAPLFVSLSVLLTVLSFLALPYWNFSPIIGGVRERHKPQTTKHHENCAITLDNTIWTFHLELCSQRLRTALDTECSTMTWSRLALSAPSCSQDTAWSRVNLI